MKKNQSNLYPFALQDQLSNGLTGQTPSVYVRKDLGSFAAASNSATEFDAQNSPGLYDITFTASECNCDVLTIKVTLPDGQEPAILDVVEMEGASSGLTAAEVWQYNGGRTLTNLDIQSELTTYGAAKTSDLSELSTFDPSTDDVTINATQAATMQTATGFATPTDVTTAQEAIIGAMPDVSGLATSQELANTQEDIIGAIPDISNLSTFNAETDAVNVSSSSANAIRYGLSTFDPTQSYVIINPSQAATMQTATGFATPTNITDAVTALEAYGDQNWRGSGGGTPSSDRPLYCNTAMLYAHWTQEKIDTWANDSQTAIDNAIEWACNKIDDDLDAAASVPFQPVPADIRDLAILAAGARLAELAGVTGDASVTAALAYYVTFVEDYNYRANA